MKKLTPLLLAAVLQNGCVSPVPPPATRSLSFSSVTHLANADPRATSDAGRRPAAPVPTLPDLKFVYPPDAARYVWTLQESSDLVNWQASTAPLISGFYHVTNDAPAKFYRMRGE